MKTVRGEGIYTVSDEYTVLVECTHDHLRPWILLLICSYTYTHKVYTNRICYYSTTAYIILASNLEAAATDILSLLRNSNIRH